MIYRFGSKEFAQLLGKEPGKRRTRKCYNPDVFYQLTDIGKFDLELTKDLFEYCKKIRERTCIIEENYILDKIENLLIKGIDNGQLFNNLKLIHAGAYDYMS